MKAIYIIGNGFDLAHGLKTSYNDFMFDYFKNAFKKANYIHIYDDELINLRFKGDYDFTFGKERFLEKFTSLNHFLVETQSMIQLSYHSTFMKLIIRDCEINNWVDIENLYFTEIKRLAKYELRSSYLDKLKDINLSLEVLRNKLFEYLSKINSAIEIDFESDHAKDILNILKSGLSTNQSNISIPHSGSLILNFNYTDTVSKYVKHIRNVNLVEIQIHGNLEDQESIIFGYGDEMDDILIEIEKKNDNLFFEHLKSFGYLKNSNYQKAIRFLDAKNSFINIHVLGHSLGLSDRILLNQIFEHQSIDSIKMHYYQPHEGKDDYIHKTHEISRHFKDKSLMRTKIIPKTESSPIPQKNN